MRTLCKPLHKTIPRLQRFAHRLHIVYTWFAHSLHRFAQCAQCAQSVHRVCTKCAHSVHSVHKVCTKFAPEPGVCPRQSPGSDKMQTLCTLCANYVHTVHTLCKLCTFCANFVKKSLLGPYSIFTIAKFAQEILMPSFPHLLFQHRSQVAASQAGNSSPGCPSSRWGQHQEDQRKLGRHPPMQHLEEGTTSWTLESLV